MRQAFEQALEQAGGSLGIWLVLNAVSDEGFVSQKILASHAHVDGATITHHVDRAETLGLVRREIDPADRRVRRLKLTSAGTRLHRQLTAAAGEFEARALAGIGKSELAQLRGTLETIRANLDR